MCEDTKSGLLGSRPRPLCHPRERNKWQGAVGDCGQGRGCPTVWSEKVTLERALCTARFWSSFISIQFSHHACAVVTWDPDDRKISQKAGVASLQKDPEKNRSWRRVLIGWPPKEFGFEKQAVSWSQLGWWEVGHCKSFVEIRGSPYHETSTHSLGW